jgi:hypothetical protein
MNYDWLDCDGYPTEECLNKIKDWKFEKDNDFRDFMEFIKSVWRYADFGYWTKENGKYSISTGGWSGNEDIIRAMKSNALFWAFYWESSERGGHYEFCPIGCIIK